VFDPQNFILKKKKFHFLLTTLDQALNRNSKIKAHQKEKGKVDLINASKAASAFTFKGSFLSSNEAAFFRTNRNVHTCKFH
jgi:hypothetical protein